MTSDAVTMVMNNLDDLMKNIINSEVNNDIILSMTNSAHTMICNFFSASLVCIDTAHTTSSRKVGKRKRKLGRHRKGGDRKCVHSSVVTMNDPRCTISMTHDIASDNATSRRAKRKVTIASIASEMQETKRQSSCRSNREATTLQRETRKVKSLTKSYMNEMSKRETACDLLQAS